MIGDFIDGESNGKPSGKSTEYEMDIGVERDACLVDKRTLVTPAPMRTYESQTVVIGSNEAPLHPKPICCMPLQRVAKA